MEKSEARCVYCNQVVNLSDRFGVLQGEDLEGKLLDEWAHRRCLEESFDINPSPQCDGPGKPEIK